MSKHLVSTLSDLPLNNPLEPMAPCLELLKAPYELSIVYIPINLLSSYANDVICTCIEKEILGESQHINFTICYYKKIADIPSRRWPIHMQIRNIVLPRGIQYLYMNK